MNFGPIDNLPINRLGVQKNLSPLHAATEAAGTFAAKVTGFFSEPVKEQRARTEIESWHRNLTPGARPGTSDSLGLLSDRLSRASRSSFNTAA